MDILGPVPLSARGNRYVLVLADYFTCWVEAFALPDQKAETVARSIVGDFICRFGAPLEIHSDQGRNFESTLFAEVCKILEVTKTRSTPYHPSANGLVERFNRTLAAMIRSYVGSSDSDWDLFLPMLTAAYRSTVHSATGFTPNYLMLGRETTMPVDIQFPNIQEGEMAVTDFALDLQKRLSECYSIARENLRRAAERQQKTHDTRIHQHKYILGQTVMKRSHKTSKFQSPWVGPYVITKVLSDCLYVIAGRCKTYAIHHDSLRPCSVETCPRWAQKLHRELTA